MNIKIALLAIVLSVLLVEAMSNRKGQAESHGRRRKNKKCHEVTTTTTPIPTTTTTPIPTTTTTPIPTTTTTPIPTTTTKAPDTSVCLRVARLNSTSGSYLKTICQTNNGLNTANAISFCQTNGMNLITLTDYETANSFVNYFAGVYNGIYISFLMNSYKNSSASNWVLYSDMSTPIYNGFNWVTYYPIFPQVGSLEIKTDGTYNGRTIGAGSVGNIVCEFFQ